MNREEIQKLIGGYATGSLTEQERRELFEAALNDQELFDALQDEQALKELFDDPISREQVRRAVAASFPQDEASQIKKWFRRPWIWAAGASIVAAAAVMLVVLVPSNRMPLLPHPIQVASERQPAPESSPSRPELQEEPPVKTTPPMSKQKTLKEEKAPAFAPPPLSVPAPAAKKDQDVAVLTPPEPVQTQVPSQQAGHTQAFVPQSLPPPAQTKDEEAKTSSVAADESAPAFRSQQQAKGKVASSTGAMMPRLALRAAPIYSFARRLEDGSLFNVPADTVFHPGETIRITLTPRVSGPLVLSEWDARNATWNRVFPSQDVTVQVHAFENYTIPLDITVKIAERLRIIVGSVPIEIPIEVR